MHYSLNDHYSWGWNGEKYNDPIPGGTYHVSVGSCVESHRSFREESVRAFTLLADQLTKPIVIGFSGGSDSQTACLAMREAKIPFTPVILQLKGPKGAVRNEHEIANALKFCEKFNLTPTIFPLDLQQFYRGRARELAAEHGLTEVQTLPQLAIVEQYRDTHAVLMGGGDLVLKKNQKDLNGPVVVALSPLTVQQHLIKYGIEGCTRPFMYTPEVIAAFLDNKIIKSFLFAHKAIFDAFCTTTEGKREAYLPTCFQYYIKPLFYCDEWPEIIQSKKFTGFEHAVELMYEARVLNRIETEKYEPEKNQIIVPAQELLDHLLTGGGSVKTWNPS